MTEVRLAPPPTAVPQVPHALRRRVKQGIVMSYIRELSKAAASPPPAPREHRP